MSNHNYSQYSKKNNKTNNYSKPKIEENITTVAAPEESLEIKMVNAKHVDSTPKREVETPCAGVVVNCSKLNVRAEPTTDADVLTTLDVGSEIMIDNARSTHEWLKITTAAGIDGFCMRRFVSAKA